MPYKNAMELQDGCCSPALLAGWQDGDKMMAEFFVTLVAEGSEGHELSKDDTGCSARARQIAG